MARYGVEPQFRSRHNNHNLMRLRGTRGWWKYEQRERRRLSGWWTLGLSKRASIRNPFAYSDPRVSDSTSRAPSTRRTSMTAYALLLPIRSRVRAPQSYYFHRIKSMSCCCRQEAVAHELTHPSGLARVMCICLLSLTSSSSIKAFPSPSPRDGVVCVFSLILAAVVCGVVITKRICSDPS
jgi:hypothetical protein